MDRLTILPKIIQITAGKDDALYALDEAGNVYRRISLLKVWKLMSDVRTKEKDNE